MNSYVGMTIVQKKKDYFSQQSTLLTLPANISPLTISYSYIAVHFIEATYFYV